MPKVRKTARQQKEGPEERRRKEVARQEALERRLAVERADARMQEADEGESEASSLPGDTQQDLPDEPEAPTGKRLESSSYNFTAAEEERLVTFFSENACFWDKRDQQFMNKQYRERKAAAIARELGCDSE